MNKATLGGLLLATVMSAAPAAANSLPDGAHRLLSVTAIGGSEPVTVPVRYDDRGDEEVYVPEHGWERCIYGSCTYTVRAYYFDRWELGAWRARHGPRHSRRSHRVRMRFSS